MRRRELLKNKLYVIAFIFLGALSIPIEWDATFFLFALMTGVILFFLKEKQIRQEVVFVKICKVKPDITSCHACMETQQMFGVIDDCTVCSLNTSEYELLQIGTGFWCGDYAMVQKDGVIKKVSLSRIYDVKEI